MSRRESTYLAPIVEEIERIKAKDHAGEDISKEEVKHYHELQAQREREVFDGIPKLLCCEDSRRCHAVRFYVDVYDSDGPPTEGRWLITEDSALGEMRRAMDPDWFKKTELHKHPEAKFCPFCATPVPKMRLKKDPPKDLCRVTDGGYYCDTCGERLRGCKCLTPEAAFEPDV